MMALAESLPQAIYKSGRPGNDAIDYLVCLRFGLRDWTGGLRTQVTRRLYGIGDRSASKEVCFHFHGLLPCRFSE